MIRVAGLLLAIALLLMGSACDNGGSEEMRHPIYVKAQKLEEKGKFKEAAKGFEDYLKINPFSAKAHYELATLYDDHLDDPFLAIYHYRRHLELDPDSREKKNIETFMKAAEKEYYDQLRKNFPDNDLIKELEAIKAREKRYVAHLYQLRSENAYLKSQLNIKSGALSMQDPSQLGAPPKEIQELPLSVQPNPAPAQSQPQPQPKKKEIPDFYVVKPGDSLTKISREIYGDMKYYKLILEANKDILSSETQVQIGQKLRIPKLPEKPVE